MGVLPGPPQRDNRGAADCNYAGLLAYACGSSVAIVELQSMQIVHALWGDKPDVYVTAVSWSPESLSRDLSGQVANLKLATGDSTGRVALWDAVGGQFVMWLGGGEGAPRSGGIILDLCWVLGRPWQLAALQAPSSLVILDTTSGKPLWRLEATEPLTCLRCDPFDARQLCAMGSRGLLLLLTLNGTKSQDIQHTEHRVPLGDALEAPKKVDKKDEKKEKDEAPQLNLRCMFSPGVPKLVYVMLPKEILAFDIEFGQVVASTPVPRNYAKLLDLLTVIDGELLYCLHSDGKLSAWLRKEKKQTFAMKHVENLLPSLATQTGVSVQVLAAAHAPTLHDAPGLSLGSVPLTPAETSGTPPGTVGTSLLSITDDGRVWKWEISAHSHNPPVNPAPDQAEGPTFRAVLAGILHTLPGLTTTLSVPNPSALTPQSTPFDGLPRTPPPPVPLAALATSAGSIEIVDTAALSVVSSFSVHSGAVRGVRWLGNSRLVSFSSAEVKGKTPGFMNKLAVTCVRSGLTKPFRVRTTAERGSMRGLRTSSSGRYLLVLFRDAPAEVWAMTRVPQMLRSLALPFAVMEWSIPGENLLGSSSHSPLSSYNPSPRSSIAAAAASAASSSSLELTQGGGTPTPPKEEPGESFAFALVNGSLGVFELRGRRVRDFRPKWPTSSFAAGDVLVTSMAYRLPYVVMGDRGGNVRWWDVKSGLSGSFPLHRGGIRRLKFAPIASGASSDDKGKVAALFTDHSIGIFDLDSGEPFNEAFVNKAHASLPVFEMEWLPHSGDPHEPLLLAVVAADGSYRHLDVHSDVLRAHPRNRKLIRPQPLKPLPRFRPVPLTSPLLLPQAQALALRMLLQQGVRPEWLEGEGGGAQPGDMRAAMLYATPPLGEQAIPEVLLNSLEPIRLAGRLLDPPAAAAYSTIAENGAAARCAFAAALFGDVIEAAFWVRLPGELQRLADGSAGPDAFWTHATDSGAPSEQPPRRSSASGDPSKVEPTRVPPPLPTPAPSNGHVSPALTRLNSAAWTEKDALKKLARERIAWHERLPGVEASQKRVHEFIATGDYESAVTLLLSTPPDAATFHSDSLRAVVLAAAVSPAMHALAVKVVAANMVTTHDPLVGTHLLCAINQYVEACSQLQEAGRWTDAGTLAVTHLDGLERARVLDRWATHVLYSEQSLWRALILFVAAGNLSEALAALHSARLPDTAAMFLLACHEAKAAAERKRSGVERNDEESETESRSETQGSKKNLADKSGGEGLKPSVSAEGKEAAAEGGNAGIHGGGLSLPGSLHREEITVVVDHYGQFQRWLAHVVGSSSISSD